MIMPLSSVTGKKSKSPKFIPNLGFNIFSPGDVVIILIKEFLMAAKLLSVLISKL